MSADPFAASLKRVRRHQRIAGAVGVLVCGDETRFVCDGVRDITTGVPVDPDTRFAIASVSKAFTATACAAAVTDGKMGWDDPVRRHLPSFRLLDPAADAHVTIRDLLCHRTGLPRHDAIWYRTPWDRAELLSRMAHLSPTATFRGAYQYNNLCFLAAGEAVAAAVGEPFEAYLKRRILEPLGMERVTFTATDAEADPDRATPHRKEKGRPVPAAWLDFTNIGPAGAMNVTPRELSAWIRFHLRGGTAPDGRQLVDPGALRETYAPQTIVPFDDTTRTLFPDRVTQTYGLGWGRTDWNGELVLSHTGSIDGFRSILALLPRRHSGYAALFNTDSAPSEMVRGIWNDLLTDAAPRDWTTLIGEQLAQEAAKAKSAEKEKRAARRRKLPAGAPVDAYAGVYRHGGYGDAMVVVRDGRLELAWGSVSASLTHWHGDHFVWDTEAPGHKRREVGFRLDKALRPVELHLMDQTFVRQAAAE